MIALADGQGKGSARSITNFHLYKALHACESSLLGYGGHAMAAGMSIAQSAVDEFRRQFDMVARNALSSDDLIPRLLYDGETELHELSLEQIQELESLSPFGSGNPQPAFVSRQVKVLTPKIVGTTHLRFDVEQQGVRFGCIAFGMAERIDELSVTVDILYRPGINKWRGQSSVQLQIADFSPA